MNINAKIYIYLKKPKIYKTVNVIHIHSGLLTIHAFKTNVVLYYIIF